MGNLKKLFCVPLWSYLLKDIKNEEIVEWSDKERKTNTGRQLTNYGGWQTDQLQQHTCFKPLIETITKIHQEISIECDLEIGDGINFQFWINVNFPGSYNILHDHPHSHLSGCYYVKVPEGDCGDLKLHSDRKRIVEWSAWKGIDPMGKHSNIEHFINPKEGLIVIFPSNIMHEVGINNTEANRISIAWNLKYEN